MNTIFKVGNKLRQQAAGNNLISEEKFMVYEVGYPGESDMRGSTVVSFGLYCFDTVCAPVLVMMGRNPSIQKVVVNEIIYTTDVSSLKLALGLHANFN